MLSAVSASALAIGVVTILDVSAKYYAKAFQWPKLWGLYPYSWVAVTPAVKQPFSAPIPGTAVFAQPVIWSVRSDRLMALVLLESVLLLARRRRTFLGLAIQGPRRVAPIPVWFETFVSNSGLPARRGKLKR